MRSVEDLHGSQKGDVLVGNGGNNAISGHCGPDRILGGGGNDVITGDDCPVNAGLAGNDRMYGGRAGPPERRPEEGLRGRRLGARRLPRRAEEALSLADLGALQFDDRGLVEVL